jgi:hypothetical protein
MAAFATQVPGFAVLRGAPARISARRIFFAVGEGCA